MSRPQRYLTRMILFVGAVFGVVLLLFPALERAFMANPALNSLIITVLLLGIGYIFRQVLILKPKWRGWKASRPTVRQAMRWRSPSCSLRWPACWGSARASSACRPCRCARCSTASTPGWTKPVKSPAT